MTDFEDQLRRALARREPSADFTARVVARATRSTSRGFPAQWRAWAAAGIAASFLVGGLGIDWQRQQQERGLEARAQLLQAMQITSSKLQRIQKRVQGEER